MNVLELDKHRLWEGRGMDRLTLPSIPNSKSPRQSPRLTRWNTNRDLIMRGPVTNDVTLKVPTNIYHNISSDASLVSSSSRDSNQDLTADVTLEVPSLVKSDVSGNIPDVSCGTSGTPFSLDEPYDSDDDLRVSMTLPR